MTERSEQQNGKTIQWYPGHMTKARRQMQEDLRLIDLLIEIRDARIPYSSANPDLQKLAEGKLRLILLAKADLADPNVTAKWLESFRKQGINAIPADARTRSHLQAVKAEIDRLTADKKERDRKKGILNRPVRTMVAGIPNVGKSTFINSYSGRSSLKTANKPGVTKGNQWIRFGKDVELLDTPGILWPKFEDEAIGRNIALIGSVNDEILDPSDLALFLIRFLNERYPGAIGKRYGIVDRCDDPASVLSEIGRVRGCLRKGGEIDEEKAAKRLIDDFRSGSLGMISLERPEDHDV